LEKQRLDQQMRKIASMSSCLISMFGILKTQTSQKGVAMDMLIDYILILIGCFWHIVVLIVVISFIERRLKDK